MKRLNKLAEEMYGEFGFSTCCTDEQEEIVRVVNNELLWIIEEFHLGAITSFDCIKQIKHKLNTNAHG